ncbi:MAG: metallophosphoesterase [Zoogloeaceae bacterium]|jgi:predicted MPP superfamily phosphohydrolase|nr:metallophosphoesterase [Zoogloeaceae bacterium]
MWVFKLIGILYLAVNALLIVRLFFVLRGARAPLALRVFLCLAAIGFSVAFPLSRVVEGNGPWVRAFTFAGTIWLAFVLHALLAWLLVGLFRLCNRCFRWLTIAPERLPRWRVAVCGGIALSAALATASGWVNTQYPTVRNVTLRAPAGMEPLRVVALSDTHLGRLVSPSDFSRLVDLIEPLRPDLVLFAGDILDDHYGFDPVATRQSLQRLAPKLGVWGVLGNHEYIAGQGDASVRLLEEGGIRILRDAWNDVGERILLIGRDDRSGERFSGRKRKTIPEILANLPARLRERPRILLDHQPFHLEEAQAANVLLQISGHTHKGQLFPFNYVVALIYENAYGYSRRDRTHYWVSSGAGTWGPRSRTTGRPEIVAIDMIPPPAR